MNGFLQQPPALAGARLLTIFSLVYVTWHYGGGSNFALRNVAALLGAATVLLLVDKLRRPTSINIPRPLLALLSVWVLLVACQPTLIAEETRLAIVPYLLAATMVFLAASLFASSRSQRWLLWSIAGNSVALSCWGIVQRIGGQNQILPGVENTYSVGLAFSSFIYKNAGAAALIPGLACLVALWSMGDGRDRRSRFYQNVPTNPLETRTLLFVLSAVVMLVGLALSLSRGAWLAASMAGIALLLANRHTVLRGRIWTAVLASGVLVLGSAALLVSRDDVRTAADNLSPSTLLDDQRWPQWNDGLRTGIAHSPLGSGLGTYGYATLPHQTEVRRSWFRDAHNQYLQVFVENGYAGIIILFATMGWFALCVRELMHPNRSVHSRAIGSIGIVLLVAGGLQSLIDFVLIVPANLLVYASLIAVVAARAGRPNPKTESRSVLWPVTGAVVCATLMVISYQLLQNQIYGDRVLAATSVSRFEKYPDRAVVSESLTRLTQSIDHDPERSDLYLRRAHWHLANYRMQVLAAARQQGHPIDWNGTQLEAVFPLIANDAYPGRDALLEGLRASSDLTEPLRMARQDIASAIRCNPMSPRARLAGTLIAPLVDESVETWCESTARLVNNSAEMLYLNGYFALHGGMAEAAIDQWSRSLRINHDFLDPILLHGQRHLGAEQVATRLIPHDRPELLVQVLMNDSDDDGIDRELAATMVRHLRQSLTNDNDRSHATIAQIQFLLGDFEREAEHWKAALDHRRRDAHYRLRYSESLFRLGRNEEALRQAVLGKSLNPGDERFTKIAQMIRSEARSP